MGSEWREVQLQEIVTVLGDGLHGTPTYDNEGDYYFINGNNLENGRIVFRGNTRKVNHDQYLKHRKELNDRTILVSINGTIGNVAYYNGEKIILGESACYFNLIDDVEKGFIRYILSSTQFQSYLNLYATGTTIKNVSLKDMREFPLRLPSREIQQAIAHILGSLDDKIELNRRMNATLEAMAQALFKSWFVDFDPVIDNALAAGHPIPEPLQSRAEARAALGDRRKPLPEALQQQFPNRFVFNEDMGWVPEGWEVGTLLDHSELISGGTPKTSSKDYWDGDIPWASAKDISQCGNAILHQTERNITKVGLDNSSTKLVGKFSTIVVSRGATTGRLAMVGGDFAMNQTCYALRSKFQAHFYQYCIMKNVIGSLVNAAHGSIFDTITTTTFQSTLILLPPIELARRFDDSVSTYFSKLYSTLKQLVTLTELRDTLLPKLLSGQLRIPEAEQQVANML